MKGETKMSRAIRVAGGMAVAMMMMILGRPAAAQDREVVDLTLGTAVEMAMDDSYQVRRVRLEIERTRKLLEAERAGLRSSVRMNFSLPQFEQISEQRWNSTLQRNEIVGENTRRWQMDFSIEQPLVLMGYPTNGYLSLNNRVYRYTQIDEDEDDLTYYNRYFIRYRQPLFQPNALKNSIERAELNLQDSELEFQNDAINIIERTSRDYYDLFELAYEGVILADLVSNLEQALDAATDRAATDPAREIEVSQTQVALSNARSELQQVRSELRMESSDIKPNLGLEARDSVAIDPTALEMAPVSVDLARAIELGVTLRPQLRMLDIQRRQNEIDIENVRGRDSFRMNFEVTYGREMEDPNFGHLMADPRNSYTLGLSGSLPIWDWGERRARIEAQQLVLQRTDLSIEETREQIEIDIINTVTNLQEYQQRAQSMQQNLLLARDVVARSLQQYRNGTITILDLLQSFERQEDTGRNFLEAYLGFRNAILTLQRMTYFDFENQMPVLERFGVLSTHES